MYAGSGDRGVQGGVTDTACVILRGWWLCHQAVLSMLWWISKQKRERERERERPFVPTHTAFPGEHVPVNRERDPLPDKMPNDDEIRKWSSPQASNSCAIQCWAWALIIITSNGYNMIFFEPVTGFQSQTLCWRHQEVHHCASAVANQKNVSILSCACCVK